MIARCLPTKNRERLVLILVCKLLPHIMLALFMTPQTQTAGHRMVALMVLFLRLANVDVFSKLARKSTEKNGCESVFIPFLSIRLVRLVGVGSPLFIYFFLQKTKWSGSF